MICHKKNSGGCLFCIFLCCFDAFGACLHCFAINFGGLKICIIFSWRFAVAVADCVSCHFAFSANFTNSAHVHSPFIFLRHFDAFKFLILHIIAYFFSKIKCFDRIWKKNWKQTVARRISAFRILHNSSFRIHTIFVENTSKIKQAQKATRHQKICVLSAICL